MRQARIPKDYEGYTLSTTPVSEGKTRLFEVMQQYVNTFERGDVKSLYLYSESPGTGKTSTACAVLTEWIVRKYMSDLRKGVSDTRTSGLFFDVNEFQTSYNLATMTKDEQSIVNIGKRIKAVQSVPFAVLDDIGVRGASEAFRAYVHAIINHRVSNGLPTIYTSNLAMSEMANVFDARLYDRIRDQCGEIRFGGESKRGRR